MKQLFEGTLNWSGELHTDRTQAANEKQARHIFASKFAKRLGVIKSCVMARLYTPAFSIEVLRKREVQ